MSDRDLRGKLRQPVRRLRCNLDDLPERDSGEYSSSLSRWYDAPARQRINSVHYLRISTER